MEEKSETIGKTVSLPRSQVFGIQDSLISSPGLMPQAFNIIIARDLVRINTKPPKNTPFKAPGGPVCLTPPYFTKETERNGESESARFSMRLRKWVPRIWRQYEGGPASEVF